jgi:ubiquinone/menaquinone biosynthesis C-methylase UbiE
MYLCFPLSVSCSFSFVYPLCYIIVAIDRIGKTLEKVTRILRKGSVTACMTDSTQNLVAVCMLI